MWNNTKRRSELPWQCIFWYAMFFYRIWNANIHNFAILWNITKMMNSCHGKGMFKFWHGILPNFAIFGVINLPCNGNNTKNCQICHEKNVYLNAMPNAYSIFCGFFIKFAMLMYKQLPWMWNYTKIVMAKSMFKLAMAFNQDLPSSLVLSCRVCETTQKNRHEHGNISNYICHTPIELKLPCCKEKDGNTSYIYMATQPFC